jgi:predicted ATPase/DNA-binding CsgD family transcriptional regulator
MREVRTVIATERLVTLLGPGGCGKSRLALRVASDVAAEFPDGIFMVELAPVSDPALVAHVVAEALEVRDRPGRHIVAVISNSLRTRRALLVVDNCEHVATEVAALVDSLLRACPDMHVLATSRIALGVHGERVWMVPPMSSRDAVDLLEKRGAAASPGFVVEPAQSAAASDICRRLDGMPLAIELASARLKTLSMTEVALRLTNRFDLLTGGDRHAQPRQRTLRATMDWSYGLLSAAAQKVWREASTFVGGFELDALEAVCSGGESNPLAVVDAVTELVDSSILAVRVHGDFKRFDMLESVREYGHLKLEESGRSTESTMRHLQWFVALAARAEPEWRGRHQRTWLARVSADLDNFRAALEFSRGDTGLHTEGLRLASALWLVWQTRHISEGRRWLSRLLDGPADAAVRAYALNVAGFLAYVQGDSAAAVPLLEESMRSSREIGEPAAMNLSMLRFGIALLYANRLAESIGVLSDALARYREEHDRVGIYVAAYELAEALTMHGDYAQARALHLESLALKELQGDRWHIAFSHFGIGILDWLEGAYRDAIEHLRESLRVRQELEEEWGTAKSIEALGWVEISRGRWARGVILLGAASAVNERLGVVLSENYQLLHDRSIEIARQKADDADLEAALRQGAGLSTDEAIKYALGDDRALSTTVRSRDGVTKREREVAALIARGMTNRDIAHSLGVSERTVDAHVEHLMNKLDYRSRAQIAAWITSSAADGKK